MIIKFLETPAYKKGSARAKWFTAIKRYDGKDVDAFVALDEKGSGSEQERRRRSAERLASLL